MELRIGGAAQTPYPRDATVHALLAAQAERAPDAIAASQDGRALTYSALDRRADRLARCLRRLGVGPGVAVGLVAQRSIAATVGLLGILKAGGAYVPLDPSYPDERLRLMLREAAAPVLVSRGARAAQLSFGGQVIELDDDGRCEGGHDAGPRRREALAADTAYIMFTSGSTGRPKGVAVPHRAIVRLVVGASYVELGPSDRVMHASSLSFDGSTFEIWGALLNGARLVIVRREALLSPSAFQLAVRRAGITVAFLTTAVFHHLANASPEAFAGLETLVVGGDRLDPKAARAALRRGGPRRLLNGYGPTENTTFSTAYTIADLPEDAASVPIGAPISGSRAYVLDGRLAPAAPGAPGELYVGGDGLASGYVGRPALTAERFIPDPFSRVPGARLYRTGDQARALPDGSLDFLGRRDRQVKIRGFRIEPGEIEAALAEHPEVREVAVVVRGDIAGDKRLVAYVAASAGAVDLRAYLEVRLPTHLVPSAFVVMPSLPLTPNGKVDRDALPEPLAPPAASGAAQPARAASPTEERLARIWAELLRTDAISPESSFFSLGGDSLLAARLLLRVQEVFAVELRARYLFEAPTLAGVARRIDHARRTGRSSDTPGAALDLFGEAALGPEIRPAAPRARRGGPPRHLLLTGATGFLGAFLLSDLLRCTPATVHCLVRAADQAEGMRRIREALRGYQRWDPAMEPRIVPVPGDLARPLLGLAPGAFEALSERVDAIYHSGACVNYIKPYEAHRDANVGGTREVLRLACAGRLKPLHHVSTIAVFGPIGYFTGARVVGEDDDIDRSAAFLGVDMGYTQSKWVAEKLALAARARGVPVSIYRPGFILGDTVTGAANQNDFVYRLIQGCLLVGSYPDLPRQRKEFVPVDVASAAIARISLDPRAEGGVYHVVPPAADSIDLRRFFGLLGEAGYPLRRLPYGVWTERLLASCSRSPDNALLPLMPMLTERVHRGLTRWQLHEGMPIHDEANTRRALQGTGIACPPLSAALLQTYLGFLVRRGILASPPRRCVTELAYVDP